MNLAIKGTFLLQFPDAIAHIQFLIHKLVQMKMMTSRPEWIESGCTYECLNIRFVLGT